MNWSQKLIMFALCVEYLSYSIQVLYIYFTFALHFTITINFYGIILCTIAQQAETAGKEFPAFFPKAGA